MIINKSLIYQEFIARHGAKSISYLKVSLAIDGDQNVSLTKDQKKNLIEIIDEAVKTAKTNISKS